MDKLVLSVSRNGYVVEHNSIVVQSKRVPGIYESKKDALDSLLAGINYCKTLCNHTTSLSIQTDISFIYYHMIDDTKKAINYLDELNACVRAVDDCDAVINFVLVDRGRTRADLFFKTIPEKILPGAEEYFSVESLLSEIEE